MKVSRQPKVSALFRVFAGACALLWLVGIGMEGVCNCPTQKEACAAHASPVHGQGTLSPHEPEHSPDAQHHHAAEVHQHATASHHDDGEAPQGDCGKTGCEDKCCCSTIQALTATMTPVVISKPVSQLVLNISLLCAAREHAFAAPPRETLRQAKPRDWVFTPEVYLGPALHSLAPPAFV